jgi:hypothetical protein
MKITKEINVTLNMESKKGYFLVYDLTTLGILMGSTSCAGNLHMYNITKIKHKGRQTWKVPKEEVTKRIDKMDRDIRKWDERLKVMEDIMKQGGK